jgi:hypothetical protein
MDIAYVSYVGKPVLKITTENIKRFKGIQIAWTALDRSLEPFAERRKFFAEVAIGFLIEIKFNKAVYKSAVYKLKYNETY